MLKSKNRPGRKTHLTSKKVAVIRNAHTAAELDEMADRWVNHQDAYLTLEETLSVEKDKPVGGSDKR